MKIFISYSHYDKRKVETIYKYLSSAGHDVWLDDRKLKTGDNIFQKINERLKSTDIFLIVISQSSINSKAVMQEVNTMIFTQISKEKSSKIIPVLIDNSPLPTYLSNYLYLDLSKNFEKGMERLLIELGDYNKLKIKKRDFKDVKKRNYENQINSLSSELIAGRLTLFCGAGVSVGAGVPSWNRLLIRLLKIVVKKLTNNNSTFKDIDPAEFNNRYSPSSLVIGKYLRNNLGNDFNFEVRDALYMDKPKTCDIIKAIINLARPQREGKPIDSIITFNFDSIIEENLDKNNIKNKPIYTEGMRNKSNELPIYHVHGYLPRSGRITKSNEIVFSEDAYHSQFIDAFSWSNLIQLNKLSQNTCLLIGLSMKDPNLRRLLDVANRKNPKKNLDHYIIKPLPKIKKKIDEVDELAIFLEEQDANELGLNVIWISSYAEIPKILNSIYEKSS